MQKRLRQGHQLPQNRCGLNFGGQRYRDRYRERESKGERERVRKKEIEREGYIRKERKRY